MKTSFIKLLRPVSALLLIGLAVYFLFSVRAVLTPFFFGFIIAYMLEPFVTYLTNKGISRIVSIALIYILLIVLISLIFFYALPVLLRDINRLIETIPLYTQNIQDTIKDMQIGYNRAPLPESIRQVGDETIFKVEQMTIAVIQGFAQGIIGLLSQTFNLVLAPILGFYFLMEYNRMGQFLLYLVPTSARPELKSLGGEINSVIKSFIRGNLLVAFLITILATVGMLLIGMDYPLLIGIMVGITNFIPYFGAIISAILAILLALLKSKWLALYVLGVMALIQQIEGNIIAPKILGSCIGLHPLLIIFALLVGAELWGFVGLLIAVPLAGILKVIMKRFYIHFI